MTLLFLFSSLYSVGCTLVCTLVCSLYSVVSSPYSLPFYIDTPPTAETLTARRFFSSVRLFLPLKLFDSKKTSRQESVVLPIMKTTWKDVSVLLFRVFCFVFLCVRFCLTLGWKPPHIDIRLTARLDRSCAYEPGIPGYCPESHTETASYPDSCWVQD